MRWMSHGLAWALFMLRLSLLGMVSGATLVVIAVALWSALTDRDDPLMSMVVMPALAVALFAMSVWVLRIGIRSPLEPPRLQKLQTPDSVSTPSVYSDHEASD